MQAAARIRSKRKMQDNDRRGQYDNIRNCNFADSGLSALCPGLSRKIIVIKMLPFAGSSVNSKDKFSNRNKEDDRRI